MVVLDEINGLGGKKKEKSICLLIINPGQDGAKQLEVMNSIFRELLGSDGST